MSMQNPQRKNKQRHWDEGELAIACQSAEISTREEQKPLLCEGRPDWGTESAWLGFVFKVFEEVITVLPLRGVDTPPMRCQATYP